MKAAKLQFDEAVIDTDAGEAQATEVMLNQLKLARIQMKFKAQDQAEWQFVFAPNAQILLSQKKDSQQQNEWHFVGENVPFEPITTLFGYQPLIEASFNFNGEIATPAEQQQVQFHFESVNGGKIKGFNVVTLLESSLPFSLANADRSLQDSKFNKLSGSLIGDSSLLQLQHIELDLPAVNLSGQGQCSHHNPHNVNGNLLFSPINKNINNINWASS